MFEVGNRVKCIRAENIRALNQNGIYTVSHVSPRGGAIRLEGLGENSFLAIRFELYVPQIIVEAPPAPRTTVVSDTRYLVVTAYQNDDPTDKTGYEYNIFSDEEDAMRYIHILVENGDYILIAKKKLSFNFNVEI